MFRSSLSLIFVCQGQFMKAVGFQSIFFLLCFGLIWIHYLLIIRPRKHGSASTQGFGERRQHGAPTFPGQVQKYVKGCILSLQPSHFLFFFPSPPCCKNRLQRLPENGYMKSRPCSLQQWFYGTPSAGAPFLQHRERRGKGAVANTSPYFYHCCCCQSIGVLD